MKLLHRAILRELLATFLMGMLALNLVLMTEQVLAMTKVLASVGATLSDIAVIIAYLQPQVAVLTMPMALLLTILLTYGRLNADNELVVMRMSGMSFREVSRPVFVLGTGCFAAGLLLSLSVAPASSKKLREFVSRVIAERAPYAIEEGIFNSAFRDIVIFVKGKPSRDRMKDVFIYDQSSSDRPVILFAKDGVISGTDGESISLALTDGQIHILRKQSTTGLSFGTYNLWISAVPPPPSKRYPELSPSELIRQSKGGSQLWRAKIILELHRRFNLPVMCLVLMFFGPPLSLKAGKTGKLGGLAIGLAVFAAYYGALMYGENLVRAGRVPHYAGAWAPALALGILSFYMFRKAEAE
jgi:lipopolysaccharide export system permease protein